MELIEAATIMHYHRHRISEFGEDTVKALGWKNKESQQKRYEVLAGIADLNHSSVLDPGCGYADLKYYLDQHFEQVTYIGIDQQPEFVKSAAERYKRDSNAHFYLGDFSKVNWPEVDYVLASGALGYHSKNEEFYHNMIIKMFGAAKKGVAFNMLDDRHFGEHPLLRAHDRSKVLAWCQKLSKNVDCVDGYLPEDFTIYLHK
ncbi:MAG: class I SAM-dependent methyltransferase [Bacteroidota bacterium]